MLKDEAFMSTDVKSLLCVDAVLDASDRMLQEAQHGGTPFSVDEDALNALARELAERIRTQYGRQAVPLHARWRHFETACPETFMIFMERLQGTSDIGTAEALIDLAVVSVLLDAGAGKAWRYHSPEAGIIGRSEGLAVASLEMFMQGIFAATEDDPNRVDAHALINLKPEQLAEGLQHRSDNALAGFEGRCAMLNALGHTLNDHGLSRCADILKPYRTLEEASDVLERFLCVLGFVFPSRLTLDGIPMGDVWHYGPWNEPVALHKLPQWLSYSCIEPLAYVNVHLERDDSLTALAEYRNGGLLMDAGVLKLREPYLIEEQHHPGSDVIIAWRALTVGLIECLADLVRDILETSSEDLPMGGILQAGTWAMGRERAARLRNGAPPLSIISDGTVF